MQLVLSLPLNLLSVYSKIQDDNEANPTVQKKRNIQSLVVQRCALFGIISQ